MKILHIVADGYTEFNSSNYRVAIPATALFKSNKAGVRIMSVSHWLEQSNYAKSLCAWADVIVIQRVLIAESIQHAATWKQKGKAIVVDFDDAYDLIRDDNAAYKFWGKGEIDVSLKDGHKYTKNLDVHPVTQFRDGLRHITAITTPSRILCKDWERYVPAFYLPNYLDLPRYEKFNKRQNDFIVIGWGGSLSHVPSFSGSGVEDALAQLFSERDDIRFLIVGDTRIKDRLPISSKKLVFSPYVKFNDWPGALLRYDIGIAPLAGDYDCRRSHLKVMEYIAMGIPFVATRSAVYQDFFKAESGEFVNQGNLTSCDNPNAEEWYHKMTSLIDNYSHYKERAEEEKINFVNIYDVEKNVDSIVGTYRRIKAHV